MKKMISGMSLVALLGGLLTSSAWAQPRIATVDLSVLFKNYWKTEQANVALTNRAADLDKEFKGLRDDYQKAKDQYDQLLADANNQAISAAERDKRKQAAEDKLKSLKDTQDAIVQFQRQATATLDGLKRRLRDNVLVDIRTVIDAKAKSAGYTLVLDSSAETPNGTPIFLFNNGENDITTNVMAQLNAAAPIDTNKSGEKK